MLGLLLALHLSLLPPGVSLFDYSSPLVSSDYASSLGEDINFEAEITLFKFLFVGGSVDTLSHIVSESTANFFPTYEGYTFTAGIEFWQDDTLPVKIGWIHECIHPMQCYSQVESYPYPSGRYEGSYDLSYVRFGVDGLNLTAGFYWQRSFLDYEWSNSDNWETASILPYMSSTQTLSLFGKLFYIRADEKVFSRSYTSSIWNSFMLVLQAETGINIGKYMTLGVRWNNMDPLAPLLWTENIQYSSAGYFSVFTTFKLDTRGD